VRAVAQDIDQPRRAVGTGPNERPPPERPTELGRRSWLGVLKRTIREFRDDELTDRAAGLTYYGVLSIFPALLALVSVLGLLGQGSIQPLIDNLASSRRAPPGTS
jgi:membrane protein